MISRFHRRQRHQGGGVRRDGAAHQLRRVQRSLRQNHRVTSTDFVGKSQLSPRSVSLVGRRRGLVLIRRKFDSRRRRIFSDDTRRPHITQGCHSGSSASALLNTPHDCAVEALETRTVDPGGVNSTLHSCLSIRSPPSRCHHD